MNSASAFKVEEECAPVDTFLIFINQAARMGRLRALFARQVRIRSIHLHLSLTRRRRHRPA